jgi:hypothetical protein
MNVWHNSLMTITRSPLAYLKLARLWLRTRNLMKSDETWMSTNVLTTKELPDYILCIISRNFPFDQREGLMSQPRVTISILHHNLFCTCSSCVWILKLSACSANKRILSMWIEQLTVKLSLSLPSLNFLDCWIALLINHAGHPSSEMQIELEGNIDVGSL